MGAHHRTRVIRKFVAAPPPEWDTPGDVADETDTPDALPPESTIIEVLPRDKILAIDDPKFVPAELADMPDDEPVIGLCVGDDARAYALSVLDTREVVNDVVNGMPVCVSW